MSAKNNGLKLGYGVVMTEKKRTASVASTPTSKTQVANIISRSHPRYHFWANQWKFFQMSYVGGKEYIDNYLFKYFKEGEQEYTDRKERAYRENHTKRVVDLINTYLFKQDATRKTSNTLAQSFIDNFDGKKRHASLFMKTASIWASVFGRVYIVIDKKTLPEGEKTGTQADNLKTIPYCYIVFPHNIKDIAFDEVGRVKWALIEEAIRNDDDPFTADQTVKTQFRLWQVGKWTLYDNAGTSIAEGDTGLDVVPIIPLDNEEQEEIAGQSLISDVANIDRAIFNNWSRLDTIVCDQTFSQLIFPIEGLPIDIAGDDELRGQFLKLATNRIVLYSAQAQAAPAFISPDATQAQFILDMIQTQIKQLFAVLGLQNETGTETNLQSGVAKAYDFDKVNKLLNSKSGNLQQAETYIYEVLSKWLGGVALNVDVTYPTEFDVRALIDDIAVAERLAMLDVSKTFTKEINKLLVLKALPEVNEAVHRQIFAEIDAKAEDEEKVLDGEVFDFDKKKKAKDGGEDEDE